VASKLKRYAPTKPAGHRPFAPTASKTFVPVKWRSTFAVPAVGLEVAAAVPVGVEVAAGVGEAADDDVAVDVAAAGVDVPAGAVVPQAPANTLTRTAADKRGKLRGM
jgi:hypothetical protein